jgi:poly(3-hydroxybutyrate) depolymerase
MKKFINLQFLFIVLSMFLLSSNSKAQIESIQVGTATRNMLVYAPPGIEQNRPLLLSLHGLNQDIYYQQNQTQWKSVADENNFVVVYPAGINNSWDLNGTSDIDFILAIIDEMYNRYGIDRDRVYLSGFSMGGMMTYYAANHIADKIAAFAPVSGYLMGGPNTNSSRPIPIIHTHGTADDVVPFSGVETCLDAWIARNDCPTPAQVTQPYPEDKPNSNATKYYWGPGTDQVEIVLLELEGVGHWHSINPDGVHTSREIWDFCKNFSLGSGNPTSITPYVQINDGSWNQTSSADVSDGDQVKFGPQPIDDVWVWSGPNGFWANTREVTISNIQTNQAGTYTATYTNDFGAESYQDFYVTVNGSGGGTISEGTYNVINRNSGKYLDVEGLGTSDGSNVHQWTSTGGTNQQWIITDVGDGYYRLSPAHATSKALDVEGISTDDGANVHIWEYLSGNNQQWRFVDVGDGYYQIEARHSGKLLEIVGASTDDGGNVQQWPNNGHHCQHWSLNQLKSAFVSTGIEEAANSTAEIQIYPNPASDGNFMIQVAQIKENENLNINIFDLQGRSVYANSVNSQNRISVNTNLQKGIYILEINCGNDTYVRKLKVE